MCGLRRLRVSTRRLKKDASEIGLILMNEQNISQLIIKFYISSSLRCKIVKSVAEFHT